MAANQNLHGLSSRLDRVFECSRLIDDDEIKSHFSKYLCVLASGYLEESIKIILKAYVSTRTNITVSNYINSTMSSLTNMNSEKIGILLNSFNNEWRIEFFARLTDEEKDAVDSVVANRHLIVHGQNVGVSYVRINGWYKNIKKVVDIIVEIVNS